MLQRFVGKIIQEVNYGNGVLQWFMGKIILEVCYVKEIGCCNGLWVKAFRKRIMGSKTQKDEVAKEVSCKIFNMRYMIL